VLDFFAGSGTTGAACLAVGERRFTLVDDNPEAIRVMRKRFAGREDIEWLDAASAEGATAGSVSVGS
jgi:site-specific DNA-methyltransferase (adenine-specific)